MAIMLLPRIWRAAPGPCIHMAEEDEMYPRLVVFTTSTDFAALWQALDEACGVPLVINEGPLQSDVTLTATSQGAALASHHFSLPNDQDKLTSSLRKQFDELRAREAHASFTAAERTKYRFEGIVGMSGTLRSAAGLIPERSAPVVLTGETGTGKTLLARAIHYEGPRHSAPFIEVDCAQTSTRALFGDDRQPGLLALAAGGTLVLNAITQLGDALRDAITDGAFDVRTIATSQGALSTNLCRLLGADPIALPPLRARRSEIIPLARYFVDGFGGEHAHVDYADLETREWPGNVRELKNVVERALLLSTPPPRIAWQ
jgi:DNA-binding NtrC family response regulator